MIFQNTVWPRFQDGGPRQRSRIRNGEALRQTRIGAGRDLKKTNDGLRSEGVSGQPFFGVHSQNMMGLQGSASPGTVRLSN